MMKALLNIQKTETGPPHHRKAHRHRTIQLWIITNATAIFGVTNFS